VTGVWRRKKVSKRETSPKGGQKKKRICRRGSQRKIRMAKGLRKGGIQLRSETKEIMGDYATEPGGDQSKQKMRKKRKNGGVSIKGEKGKGELGPKKKWKKGIWGRRK